MSQEIVQVRKMTESDFVKAAGVFRIGFNNMGESWSEETSLAHVRENFMPESSWVAEIKKEVVGLLLASVITREEGPELFIDSIVVLPQYQKQGVGEVLWSEAENFAKKEELRGLRLLANPDYRSYQWYKSMDFIEDGWVELFRRF